MAGKLQLLAREIADTRKPLTAAALAAKQAFIATRPDVVGHVVARGKVGVRYDIRGNHAVVRFTGPAHLALNPTSAHRIAPRRRRAIVIDGHPYANADHPGTRGKDPGARRAKAAGARVAPKAYHKVGVQQPLRRIF
jgi:hypothetical protein